MGARVADNVFKNDPIENFITEMKAPPTQNYRASIDTIASQSRVPANFLMAFSELAPAKTDEDRTKAAQVIADRIAPRIRSGEKIEDVVRSISGDNKEAADRFIERAYQIADEHYAQPKEEPGLGSDIVTQAKATAKSVAGSTIKGLGIAAEEALTLGQYYGPPTKIRQFTNKIADDIAAASDATRGELSKETLDAIANSTPDGHPLKPWTWTPGKDPSLRGYSFLAMDVLGSLLPVVATAVVTRSPGATAAVGGAMGGGDAATTARQIVIEADKTIAPNGKSVLENGSPYYRAMLQAGRTPEEALALTVGAAEKSAFLMTAPVSAFGGAATQRIIAPAEGAIIKGGPFARILGTAALSGLEEGVQEASETIAARYGTQRATGMELDLANGTFGDFILGALGGAVPGGVSGAFHRDETDQPEEGAPLALPAPRQALPAPPKGLPAPRLALPAPEGAAPAAPPRSRPFKAALDAAPDKVLPGVTGAVTVRAGNLPPFVGTIYSDNGVLVSVVDENGEVIEISRQQLESGEATIETADAAISDVNVPETPSEAAESVIAKPEGAKPGIITPDEARRRIGVLEDQARTQGWTARRLAKKQELEAIIASEQTDAAAPEASQASPSTPAQAAPEPASQDGEAAPITPRFIGTFERPATDSAETVTVSVTPDGPWDFNDTWPAPDPEKVAAREQEGRIDFLEGEGPDAVVGILTETLGELTAEMGFARQWEAQVEKIKSGQKPDFKVKKGEDALKIAEANVAEAKRNVDGIDGALRDIWSDDAVDAMGAEIAKTLDAEQRAPQQAPSERTAAPEMAKMATLDKTQPEEDDQVAPENILTLKGGKGYGGRLARFILRGDDQNGWKASIDYDIQGFAGGGLDSGVKRLPTREAAIKEAARRLRQQVEDIADGRRGSSASPRHVREAQKIVRWATEFFDDHVAVTPQSDAGRLPTEADDLPSRKESDRAKATPSGSTHPAAYRLDQTLTDQHRKALAKYRDTDGGELVGEIDNALRRVADERRRKDSEQYRLLTAEGEQIARNLIADMRKKKGVIDLPSRDEDTGEWALDGSPASDALEWLDLLEQQGVAIDASDHAEGDGEKRAPGEVDRMPDDQVFPAVKTTVNLDKEGKASGEISLDEAQRRIAEWKRIAAEIGKTGRNRDKIIVSLFDYTGAWSQPWVDAGYQVLRFDIKTGSDILTDDFFWNRLTEIREEGKEVYGVLSATPCTTFAGSGARWWEGLHDKESPEAVAKVFGERALSSGAKSPLEYNLMLVRASRDAIALAAPTGFHVLENPIGRIETAAKLPPPRARFHPYNFGDPYTKYTQLFGDFDTDLPFANVDPVDGSKVQSKFRGDDPLGKENRSTTPEGFAYAFFIANDSEAGKMLAAPKEAPRSSWTPRAPRETGPMPKTQSDLFGAQAKSDDEMALAERRKRQWGQFLAIAESGRSTWEGDLEGATAYINKNRVTLTTDAGSRTVDTDGMSRGDIVGWARWAMQQIHGFAEKAAPIVRESGSNSSQIVPDAKEVRTAAKEADRNPTDGQKEAGNYKMGHTTWRGLDITLETAKGAMRRGKDRDGEEWSVKMPAHYGYIKRTEGADGDHLDVYMGDDTASEAVFVVDQVDADTGKFDEHKVMLGFPDQKAALAAYDAGFSDGRGPERRGAVTMWTAPYFAEQAKNPDQWMSPVGRLPNQTKKQADAAAKPEKGWRKIGKNHRGNDVFEDERGVRAYSEAGIRVSETVGFVPGGGIELPDPVNRGREFKTVEEAQPPAPVSTTGMRVFVNKIGADGLTDAERTAGKEPLNKADARKPAERANPPKSALSDLSQAKQDRAALLRARIADRMKNQLNAGLDPELLKDAVELVGIYIEAGMRKFGALVRQVASDMGITAKEIEPWARAAYNQARDDMELDGQDVADMDDAKAVLAEVKAIRAEVSPKALETPILEEEEPEGGEDADRVDAGDDRTGPASGAEPAAPRPERARNSGEGNPQEGQPDDGAGRDAGRTERRASDAGNDLFGGAGRNDVRPRNHVIQPGELSLKSGEKTRARESVAAIRLVKQLEAEGRAATPEERKTLSLYGGAGTLAGALPRSDGSIKFPDIAADLDSLLTEEEKRTLSRTSQYAFYTAEPALRSMWRLAERLGFRGGKVYEPGMGVGGFVGTMPANVRPFSTYQGLELDHVTAAIAKALYPESVIQQGDFIKTPLAQNHYDLVIGNPPFAGIKVQADADYPQGFMLHDYFFAKSLDAVRPGGVLMFITSAGTMNKLDAAARDYLADRADLLGAIRLPNTAFKENGTEVTTDIVVLRKRLDGEAEADPSWRSSKTIDLPDPDGGTGQAAVNQYFIDHPEMILGEQGLYDTLTAAARVGVRPKPGSDLAADLAAVLDRFPSDAMSRAAPSAAMGATVDAAAPERKTGAYYVKDGDLWQFDGKQGRPVDRKSRSAPSGMSKGDYDTVMALLPIRDALREVYAADVDGKDATAARKKLNAVYDAFVKSRGPIGRQKRSYRRPSVVEQETARQRAYEDARAAGIPFDQGSFDPSDLFEAGASLAEIARERDAARKQPGYSEGDFNPDDMPDKIIVSYPNIDAFAADPESFRLRAIERYNPDDDTAAKTRVFTENAVTTTKEPVINSPEDALLYVMGEHGRIDLNQIADLAKSTPGVVRDELGDKIFLEPISGEWQTSARYLSGNVRKKLAAAREAARTSGDFDINVSALERVQPAPIPAEDIRVPIGAHWFDASIYSQFAQSLGLRLEAAFQRGLGIWTVEGSVREQSARNEYGTEDMPFGDLMKRIMNNKAIKVTRTAKEPDGSTRTFTDDTATQAANDKAQELKQKFSEWFWSDEARKGEMQDRYNEVFNSEVAPSYDGGYLTTPGIHSEWRWRPHQTAAIARILQEGNTYLAHAVGAGKTSEMIGAVMEGRRLGLVKKPMISVPNHMLVQFATEFYQQYPLANILVADEARFHTSRRKQFIADVALGDWDAIIITHSAMELIPVSEKAKAAAVQDILADIREVVDGAGATGDRGGDMAVDRALLGSLESIAKTLGIKTDNEKGTSTRKKIERLLEQAEQRIARQTSDKRKDEVFNFDELGIDQLMVDEAHLFRKLSFATTNGNIKGIDPAGSMQSMDLYIKTRALEAKRPGRSLVLASGTPITNTMAELYTLSRYLQPQALAERGMTAFDAWAASFGEVESQLEQTPDGGYKEVSRFSKFVNTPELSLMVRQIMDVVSSRDLEKYVTRPKLRGGQRTHVVVEPSPEVLEYRDDLSRRMQAIQNRKGPVKKGDDILLSVINDGRLSAIDMRLVDPSASGSGSKLDRMIQNVYREWEKGKNAAFHGVKREGGYTDEPVAHGASTQIVFATLGVNPSKHNPDFSVHRFIKAELVRMGVPASDIILNEELKTHALKQRAFGDMNEGRRRILVGSKTLFTGVNAQKRVAAIHNLDPLWFPADDEQRNGRGIRQGNMNPEIAIFDYSTKGTYDATMWQMMARKAGFIEGFFRGDPTVREIEDLGEASTYEQAKAVSTKDPRVLQLTEMKAERDKLQRRADAVKRQKTTLSSEIRYQENTIERQRSDLADWEKVAPKVQDTSGDKFAMTVGGAAYEKRTEAGNALIAVADEAVQEDKRVDGRKVGDISGFPVILYTSKIDNSASFSLGTGVGALEMDAGWGADAVGMVRRIETALQNIGFQPGRIKAKIAEAERKAKDARDALGKVKDFSEHAALIDLRDKIAALEAELLSEAEPEKKESRILGDSKDDAARALTFAEEKALLRRINEALKQHGLSGRINAKILPIIFHRGKRIAGTYTMGTGMIEISGVPGADGHMATLRHEIIHALRDDSYWGKPFGLFTEAEWRALGRAAQRDDEIMRRIDRYYSDQSEEVQIEEAIAELYRKYAEGRETPSRVMRVLEKVRNFLGAVAAALRGEGFASSAETLEKIARGEIGQRAQPRDERGRFVSETQRFMRDMPDFGFARTDAELDAKERGIIGHILTAAMNGKNGTNLLALVPGRPLFAELGKKLPSAIQYLRNKEEMDALRNQWHAKTDEVAQAWRKLIARNGEANKEMMDLMHEATIAGVDPSRPFVRRVDNLAAKAREYVSRFGADAPEWAVAMVSRENAKQEAHKALKARYDKLPEDFKAMFVRVRRAYQELGDEFEKTVIENAKKAMQLNIKRAKQRYEDDLRAIDDEGLEGDERAARLAAADKRLEEAKARADWNRGARLSALRAKFESNRIDGPYFPLARFGNFFLTVRDEDGKVISFSKFETERKQQQAAQEWQGQTGITVQMGVLSEPGAARKQVDPNFVADIEEMIGEAGAGDAVMDAIWQRWLDTLPEMSVRRSRMHRKGTEGFDRDAFKAFGRQLFHGAHQLARLKYAQDMQQNLDDARREAANADDPNRAGLIVNEMERRNDFVMNPTGSAWAQAATSAAFVYYLAVTPAAAIVNLTQTTIVGIPVLSSGFRGANLGTAAVALTKAARDFINGRGHSEASRNLSPEERNALHEAYRRGTVDKTQSHDLAGVAETGVEYSAVRQKVMGYISWFFHHAERMNREVTFLAAYRMARDNGFEHAGAIDKAADLTWKTHFDYQNTSRPRLMQNDYAKVLLTFRNFQVNMLYRLFRDLHQAFKGATPEERSEARGQIGGITMMLMAHAGITGTWGYALTIALLGMFSDDGGDDVEEALQTALVNLFGPQIAGMLLKGVPGHLTGVNLSNRIGMPELWFRSSDRQLEGDDVYNYWLTQIIGPIPGIAENTVRGVQKIGDGEYWRGVETILPKALRDMMKSLRYATEGVNTYSGNPILDDVNVGDAIKQALGFTPARIAEAYDVNTKLRNREQRILDERSRILGEAAQEARDGGISEGTMDRVQAFNEANPDYPITGKTIRTSLKSRLRAANDTSGGIRLNSKLDRRLREEAAPRIYQ